MKILARSLMVFAIAGQIGFPMLEVQARPGGAGPGAGPGSASGGHGHGVNGAAGVSGTTGGYGGQSGTAGHDGTGGQHGYGATHGDPAPSPSSNGGAPTNYDRPPVAFTPPPFDFQAGFTALGAPSGACGASPPLPDTSWYSDPVDGIELLSQMAQNRLQFCGCDTQACVADALDDYASALEKAVEPAPPVPGGPPVTARKLPRAVRALPGIVHEAAARVRAAPTKAVAEKAVQAAIEVVQKTAAKTIALMRADDPDAKKAITRGSDLVADTLRGAKSSLERAETL